MNQLQVQFSASIILSCQAALLSRTAYYYQTKRIDDCELMNALLALIEKHPRWGYPKCRKRLKALGYR